MRSKGILAGIAAAVAAACAIWLLMGTMDRGVAPDEEPGENIEAASAVEPAAQVAEEASGTEPVETTPEVPDIIEDLPTPAPLDETLVAVRSDDEPVISDPRCMEIARAMKERLGWDRIDTMRCNIEIKLGDMAFGTLSLTMEAPGGTLMVMSGEQNGQPLSSYQVTDGVLIETGRISPEGERVPYNMGNWAGTGSMAPAFSWDMFDPEKYTYTEAVDYTADPADPMFQKVDGSAPDNLNLTILKGEKEDMPFEMYVDTQSMRMVGLRVMSPKDGRVAMQSSPIEYEEVAEDILYPKAINLQLFPAAMGAPAEIADLKATVRVGDFVVNEPIKPDTFFFAKRSQQP
jgi:hypothetical protein